MEPQKALLTDINALTALTDEAVELLKQLIATPRISRAETEAADLLERFMKARGLKTQREANNLWVIADGFEPQHPTLLLNAHIDTVKPVSAWTRDPHKPTLEGDRLYGLGSNDDGASLVSLLQVFRVLIQRPQTYNLIFLASAEEEVSGSNGIERTLPLLPPIDVALVGEPTRMQPAIAEKGLMVIDVTAHGRAGHAARNEGDNAIYHALDDIAWVRAYHFPKHSPLLGPVKMTATIIQAGTQHNVIPDTCTFTIDVRSNECYSNEELFQTISNHLQSEARVRSLRLNSSRIGIDHPLVQRAVSLPPTPDGQPRTPFGSPTLSDQALMRCPSLKMGPGDSARSHTADEYICISELRDAIRDYLVMLDGMNLQPVNS